MRKRVKGYEKQLLREHAEAREKAFIDGEIKQARLQMSSCSPPMRPSTPASTTSVSTLHFASPSQSFPDSSEKAQLFHYFLQAMNPALSGHNDDYPGDFFVPKPIHYSDGQQAPVGCGFMTRIQALANTAPRTTIIIGHHKWGFAFTQVEQFGIWLYKTLVSSVPSDENRYSKISFAPGAP